MEKPVDYSCCTNNVSRKHNFKPNGTNTTNMNLCTFYTNIALVFILFFFYFSFVQAKTPNSIITSLDLMLKYVVHTKKIHTKNQRFFVYKNTQQMHKYTMHIHWLLRIWMSVLVYVFFFCILSLLCWTMNVAIAINVIHVVWYLDYTSFFSAIASKKHTRGIYSTG